MRATIVIPHYNEPAERTQRTIDSAVVSCVAAGVEPEVVLVDDGSARAPLVKPSPYIRILCSQHRGISAALNRGIANSTGEVVCWLSVGDLMHRDKIGAQLAHLATGVAASFHRYEGDDRAWPFPSSEEQERVMLRRLAIDNCVCGSTTMVTRDVAVCYPFDEHLLWCLDWNHAAAVQFCGPGWRLLDRCLGSAREYPGGHTDRGASDPRRALDRATVARRWRNATRGRFPDWIHQWQGSPTTPQRIAAPSQSRPE